MVDKIRSAFDGSRVRRVVSFSGPGRTKQSFKDECDINNIMRKYQKTGLVEAVNKHQARYGDVPAMDFREAVENLRLADEMFMDMPSNVRKRFDNDPGEFLAFVQDPANRDEAIELGLIIPPVADPSAAVPAAGPAPAAVGSDPGAAAPGTPGA